MDPFYADHTDMVHCGVLVHQSIAPQGLEDDLGQTCPMTARVKGMTAGCSSLEFVLSFLLKVS